MEESYESFAGVYDLFMDNIDYPAWCTYLTGILKEYGIEDGLIAELGCGTGSMTELLAAEGYDMIGIDNSPDMLEVAQEKRVESGLDILYLMQDMREFELYGTVRAVVSICDCMNYILEEEDLLEVFCLANNYLDPGGILGLGIYVAFQPGAVDGYHYIFRVDGKALGDPKTWIFALGQAFFSLSVAGNGTLIYGSYLPDEENIPAAAGRVAFFDTLAAMLAALVIIPAMATTGAQLDQGGPGLLFIFLPNLIKNMPGGKIIVIIFFVAVLFAGLTSLINLYEAPIATVQEKFHLERKPACAVIAVIGVIVSILIQGIVSGWMDVLSIYICPLGAGLAGIMLFWVCGKEYVEKQVNKGRSSHLTSWFYPICKYVYVPVCILVLVLGIALGGIG